MSFKIHYYSFRDPITGNTTKGYGYSAERHIANIVAKVVDGEVTVNKNELVTKSVKHAPQGADVFELSKEEFDRLDTTGESLTFQLAREKAFLQLKKLEKRFANQKEPLDTRQLELKLQSVMVCG